MLETSQYDVVLRRKPQLGCGDRRGVAQQRRGVHRRAAAPYCPGHGSAPLRGRRNHHDRRGWRRGGGAVVGARTAHTRTAPAASLAAVACCPGKALAIRRQRIPIDRARRNRGAATAPGANHAPVGLQRALQRSPRAPMPGARDRRTVLRDVEVPHAGPIPRTAPGVGRRGGPRHGPATRLRQPNGSPEQDHHEDEAPHAASIGPVSGVSTGCGDRLRRRTARQRGCCGVPGEARREGLTEARPRQRRRRSAARHARRRSAHAHRHGPPPAARMPRAICRVRAQVSRLSWLSHPHVPLRAWSERGGPLHAHRMLAMPPKHKAGRGGSGMGTDRRDRGGVFWLRDTDRTNLGGSAACAGFGWALCEGGVMSDALERATAFVHGYGQTRRAPQTDGFEGAGRCSLMQHLYRHFAACCILLHLGLSDGHGWFRASDLSRVKRYATLREIARSACKCAQWAAGNRVLRSDRPSSHDVKLGATARVSELARSRPGDPHGRPAVHRATSRS